MGSVYMRQWVSGFTAWDVYVSVGQWVYIGLSEVGVHTPVGQWVCGTVCCERRCVSFPNMTDQGCNFSLYYEEGLVTNTCPVVL